MYITLLVFLVFLVGVVLLSFIIKLLSQETFDNLPEIGTRYICPTRNQNFDLRQDIPIPRKDWSVFNSTIGARHPEKCKYKYLE